jgi:hypothetical protein
MESKVELTVLEDTDRLGYFIHSDNGRPIFGPPALAATYSSTAAVENAVSRIEENYSVRYRRVRLEVLEER